MDNLGFSWRLPRHVPPDPDPRRVLGFERPVWTVTGGTNEGLSVLQHSQGLFSQAVKPQTYAFVRSPKLASIGPVSSSLSFDLRLPTQQPNPLFFGAVQLFVDLPSKGLFSYLVGQLIITDGPLGEFRTMTFPLPSSIVTALNGTYTDLSFTIGLLPPAGASGTYHLDHFRVGSLTDDPLVLPQVPLRLDLIGTASTGLATLAIDGGSPKAVDVEEMIMHVKAEDVRCAPSSTKACRFFVEGLRVRLGAFDTMLFDVDGMTMSLGRPFSVVLGGGQPLAGAFPPGATFFGPVLSDGTKAVAFEPGRDLTVAINPSGAGLMALAGHFTAKIDGHLFDIALSVTADTPLFNRPPASHAGPDQTVESSTDCGVLVHLDGRATDDPDGNLDRILWSMGDTFLGMGIEMDVRLDRPGQNVITARAFDTEGSEDRDSMTVFVSLPASCET